jgi:hypothetical protein
MTEHAAAPEAEQTAGPRLIHTGVYAVYESLSTPGGVHVTWRRSAAWDDETGQVRDVEGAADEHMPDIPPEALPLIGQFIASGIPPAILAVLQGKASPLALLRQLAGSNGDGGQGEHVHVAGDPPCNGCGWAGSDG